MSLASLTFASAATFPLERVTQAFNLGFAQYYLPMNQTPEGMAAMMRENDVILDASAVLLIDGAIAGIGLVAIRGRRGWVAGMGVAPVWRGQGIGQQLLSHLLDNLAARGVNWAQLEALDANAPALALYHRMGFQVIRPLTVYHGELHATHDASHAGKRVRAVTLRFALGDFDHFHPVAPAWQRERATLARMRGAVRGLGLWEGSRLRAYVLYARQSQGYAILDAGAMAPEREVRGADIATILQALATDSPGARFHAINCPPQDPLGDALTSLACPVALTQRELARTLP